MALRFIRVATATGGAVQLARLPQPEGGAQPPASPGSTVDAAADCLHTAAGAGSSVRILLLNGSGTLRTEVVRGAQISGGRLPKLR